MIISFNSKHQHGTLIVLSIYLLLLQFTEQHPKSASLLVLVHPPNVTVAYGANITLDCLYNKLVNCVWKRNETIVKINGRYKYLELGSTGTNTRNCSISIMSADFKRDSTSWQCSMKQTDKMEQQAQSFIGKITVLNYTSLSYQLATTTSATGIAKLTSLNIDFPVTSAHNSSSNECPIQRILIGETVLLGLAITTSAVSIILAIIIIYMCFHTKKKNMDIHNNGLQHDKLSINSGCNDSDTLIRSLPTINDLQRIESRRKSKRSSAMPYSNKMESTSPCYAIVVCGNTLLDQRQQDGDNTKEICQIRNSDQTLMTNPYSEDNDYLTPKNVTTTSHGIENGQRKNPYGAISRQHNYKEPIYLEVN